MMKLKDNPFKKYSYGDEKTKRNCFEVSAVALVAERLGIPGGIVDPAGHNYYFKIFCEDRCCPHDPEYPCQQKQTWQEQIRQTLITIRESDVCREAVRFGLMDFKFKDGNKVWDALLRVIQGSAESE